MNLNELRDEAHSIAKANGWHEEEHSDEHWLMLVITEIAEAVQADRKNLHADVEAFKKYEEIIDFKENFERQIKNTVEDELADIVIRCLDLAGLRNIDLSIAQVLFKSDTNHTHDLSQFDFPKIAFGMVQAIAGEEGIEALLNGTILGIMVFCAKFGIDLPFFIRTKMKYNRLRGYHHGGRRY